jgi:hypothetical protein
MSSSSSQPSSTDNNNTTTQCIFTSDTRFTNKYTLTRYKNLRCFPDCGLVHRERQFCGSPVTVAVNLPSSDISQIKNIYVFGTFRAKDSSSKYEVGSKCREKSPESVHDTNQRGDANHFSASLRQMQQGKGIYTMYPPNKWRFPVDRLALTFSTQQDYVFSVYVIHTELEKCIANVDSPPFKLISKRSNLTSVAGDDDVGDNNEISCAILNQTTSGTGSSISNQSSTIRSATINNSNNKRKLNISSSQEKRNKLTSNICDLVTSPTFQQQQAFPQTNPFIYSINPTTNQPLIPPIVLINYPDDQFAGNQIQLHHQQQYMYGLVNPPPPAAPIPTPLQPNNTSNNSYLQPPQPPYIIQCQQPLLIPSSYIPTSAYYTSPPPAVSPLLSSSSTVVPLTSSDVNPTMFPNTIALSSPFLFSGNNPTTSLFSSTSTTNSSSNNIIHPSSNSNNINSKPKV